MTVSVIITTRNRREDLDATLQALRKLDPSPAEILVCLDGCSDGSADMLRRDYPAVRVLMHSIPQGSIPSRHRLIREARSDLVLSLDDDSHPVETHFLQRSTELFEADKKLAVGWFPQRSEEFPESLDRSDFGPDCLTGSYVSSGAMLRRSTYLSLPGYAIHFGHAYEEPDYALQCIAAGWRIRLHTGLVIRHHYSARNRNERRTHQLHSRNECWSVFMRCPWPWWPLVALKRAAGQLGYACRRGPRWVLTEPVWWLKALRGTPAAWSHRQPVSWTNYRRWRQLLRRPEPVQ